MRFWPWATAKAGDHAAPRKATASCGWLAKDASKGLGNCRHRRVKHTCAPADSAVSLYPVVGVRYGSLFSFYTPQTWSRPGAPLLAPLLEGIPSAPVPFATAVKIAGSPGSGPLLKSHGGTEAECMASPPSARVRAGGAIRCITSTFQGIAWRDGAAQLRSRMVRARPHRAESSRKDLVRAALCAFSSAQVGPPLGRGHHEHRRWSLGHQVSRLASTRWLAPPSLRLSPPKKPCQFSSIQVSTQVPSLRPADHVAGARFARSHQTGNKPTPHQPQQGGIAPAVGNRLGCRELPVPGAPRSTPLGR